MLAVATVALALTACGSDGGTTELPPLPTGAGPDTTAAPPTSAAVPDTTTVSSPSDTAATETTAPDTTIPETTAPETTAPGTTVPAPSTATAAFMIGGDDDAPLLPLAWWDGGTWRLSDDEFPLTGGETAVLTSVDDTTVSATLSSPSTDDDPFAAEACFDGRTGLAADGRLRAPEVPGFGYSTLAVVAPWDVVPRPSAQVGLAVDEYREIGARFADGLGGDGSLGEVTQVVRVDLDGDGVEEVLVTFEHIQPSIVGAPGDYSIVYLRSPTVTGEVDDDLVAAWMVDPELPEDEFPYLLRSRVMAVADLDGDGTMEVALHRWYYEGTTVEIFRITGRTIESVASNGCGA
jgi:hypothetical protein